MTSTQPQLFFGPKPQIELSDSDWRCLATIIDCEGSIHIGVANYGRGYSAIIRVGMTSEDYMNCVNSLYPGRFAKYSSGRDGCKPVFEWKLIGYRCRNFLDGILPFLIIKPRQAKLLLELLQLQREWHNRYPLAIRRRRLEIYEEMKRLNKKGI